MATHHYSKMLEASERAVAGTLALVKSLKPLAAIIDKGSSKPRSKRKTTRRTR